MNVISFMHLDILYRFIGLHYCLDPFPCKRQKRFMSYISTLEFSGNILFP